MAKNSMLNPARLLKMSGLGALAAALAMMTMPADALAQNGRGHRGGGHSAQAQSGGGGHSARSQGNGARSWSGNRGGRDGVSRRGNGGGDGQRSWSGNRGGDHATSRNRSGNAQSRGNWANQRRGDSGQRWRNRNNGGNGENASARRAARIAEIERLRGAGNNGWSNQQGAGQQRWSGRNRSYSDRDRNRSYRQGSRGDRARNDAGRWNRGNESWRNDPGRWNNDNRNWRSNGNRWANDGSRRWDRNWRRDNRYDWHGYRNHNRNIYRLGRYHAPYRNYSYRRFGVGFYLDSLFFSSRYWIDDPWYYRLPPADGPYRWIRYYDDALLVDIHTGEVIDVIHDFFW